MLKTEYFMNILTEELILIDFLHKVINITKKDE